MADSYILVVDDSKPIREVLRRALVKEGYSVLQAEDGRQALDMVAANPISLILLDVEMPNMTGLEVLEYLRARFSYSELAILMISSTSDSPKVVEAIDKGANDYLYKPVNIGITLAKVKQQLGLLVQRADKAAETTESSHLFLQAEPPKAGDMLNQYQLVESIGEGGMGQVFSAFDKRLHREVAVKVIKASRLSLGELDALLYEARTVVRIDHPGVVRVFEVSFDPYPYIAMELLVGKILHDFVSVETPIVEIRDLMVHTLEVLQAIHSKGIIHRDLKPSNIMIINLDNPNSPPQVKIMDFGIAGHHAALAFSPEAESACGTPQYASPEHLDARLRPITAQSDIFSMGIILYEALTGYLPFSGSNFVGLACSIIEETPVAPKSHRPELSTELSKICMKALEKDKTKRFHDAQSFARALRECKIQ